jgi:tetraacyldisaccharide 4'-kinase
LRRGPLACLLWPVSVLFCVLVRLRRVSYRLGLLTSSRLKVPVVVVGNIFIGGTGKTPLVIWLVEQLRVAGHVPAVISRGYGAQASEVREVTAESSVAIGGDEPVLIAQRAHCPVMVGRDRVAAGRALLAAHPDVTIIISDDGLQHYALQRDVEIVLCDSRGNGNGWTLPAGPLREPASRPRDFSVVNGDHLPADVPEPAFRMELRADSIQQLADPARRLPLRVLASIAPRVVAAAGIGNPARFFATLESAGLRFKPMPLPDHYDFSSNPFATVEADYILITEKDAVKCRQLAMLNSDPRLWVVPVTAQIDAALATKILEKCRGRTPA